MSAARRSERTIDEERTQKKEIKERKEERPPAIIFAKRVRHPIYTVRYSGDGRPRQGSQNVMNFDRRVSLPRVRRITLKEQLTG